LAAGLADRVAGTAPADEGLQQLRRIVRLGIITKGPLVILQRRRKNGEFRPGAGRAASLHGVFSGSQQNATQQRDECDNSQQLKQREGCLSGLGPWGAKFI
jgi:hypothetical protein